MTTNLLGATVEIADDYSRGVHPPTITRAVIRAVEIPSAGVRLVVMREDGTLRVVEGTGTGDTKVRVVAEENANAAAERARIAEWLSDGRAAAAWATCTCGRNELQCAAHHVGGNKID